MSDVKKFGQSGVGSDVQFGKKGPRLIADTGTIKVTGSDGTTLTTVQGADGVSPNDFVTVQQISSGSVVDGAAIPLGNPTDGSLTDGAITLSNTIKVTDAIDRMNEVLGLLIPAAPPTWPNGSAFTVTGAQSFEVASGTLTDNTGAGVPTSGNTVSVVYNASVSTSVVGGSGAAGAGPGTSGTMAALLNGTAIGSRTLTVGSDNGTYGKLVLSGNVDYPSDKPGFWEVIQAQISGATALSGYNKVQITHTDAQNTAEVFFLYDNVLSGNASVASPSVTVGTGSTAMSSGIPHYVNGATVNVSGTANNLAGLSYRKTALLSVDGIAEGTDYVAIASQTDYNAGQVSIPNPLPQGATGVAFSNAALTLADTHSLGHARVRARNPNGGSFVDISSPKILVMGTASTSRIDEDNILVNGELGSSPVSANAARIVMIDGDTPNATFTGTTTDWNASAIDAHDAVVVGGVLKHDTTNYSTGYLPSGPDYSSKNANQYITFMFRRTPVSKFDISITGTIAGCWVKLPGVTNATYTANNEWRNLNLAYGNGYGCALGAVIPVGTAISSGRYTCTFGLDSSANSTNNIVLVRLKLTTGQKVTALSFRGASN
jgi:hypothetical protein